MTRLPYRKPRLPDLGVVFGVVYAAAQKARALEAEIAEDLRAFHAPSECGDLAYRGVDRIVEQAIEFAEATTGMTWREILNEAYERTSGRWVNWTLYSNMIPYGKEG